MSSSLELFTFKKHCSGQLTRLLLCPWMNLMVVSFRLSLLLCCKDTKADYRLGYILAVMLYAFR